MTRREQPAGLVCQVGLQPETPYILLPHPKTSFPHAQTMRRQRAHLQSLFEGVHIDVYLHKAHAQPYCSQHTQRVEQASSCTTTSIASCCTADGSRADEA